MYINQTFPAYSLEYQQLLTNLFCERCKSLGGVLGAHVKHRDAGLQGSGHQLVHLDVLPV